MTIDIPAELEKQIVRLSAKAELSPQEYALRSLIRSVTEDSKVKGKVPNNLIMELYQLVDLIEGKDESSTDAEFDAFVTSQGSPPEPVAALVKTHIGPTRRGIIQKKKYLGPI